jgi:hypothetical protein
MILLKLKSCIALLNGHVFFLCKLLYLYDMIQSCQYIYINKKSEDILYIYFMLWNHFILKVYVWWIILVNSQAMSWLNIFTYSIWVKYDFHLYRKVEVDFLYENLAFFVARFLLLFTLWIGTSTDTSKKLYHFFLLHQYLEKFHSSVDLFDETPYQEFEDVQLPITKRHN